MRISILLSIRLSKRWTLKRSTFLMSYISPQAGATSASEMKINDWEVQIWRASLWQASHLATFCKFTWQRQAKKVKEGQTWALMTPKTCGTATISCADNLQSDVWQLHNIRFPSFFVLGYSARCIAVQVQRYAMEHSVSNRPPKVILENIGVTLLHRRWMAAHDQLQDQALTLQPVTAGKSRFKPSTFRGCVPWVGFAAEEIVKRSEFWHKQKTLQY